MTGWIPDEDETLIDRVCDPAKTLTRLGKVQCALWLLCLALLITVLATGSHSVWSGLALVTLILLLGIGFIHSLFGFRSAVLAARERGRLRTPGWLRKAHFWRAYDSPTAFIAAVMLLAATVVCLIYFRYDRLTAWGPGIVIGIVTIAITVTVVKAAFRASESRRENIRRQPASRQISEEVDDYVLTQANRLAVSRLDYFPNDPIQTFPSGWTF